MRALVKRSIHPVCSVATDLRRAALNFGIVSALERLAGDIGRRHAIACASAGRRRRAGFILYVCHGAVRDRLLGSGKCMAPCDRTVAAYLAW